MTSRMHKLKQFFTCKTMTFTIVTTIIYVILALVMPRQPFLEFVRIMMATMAAVVLVAFSSNAWDAMTSDKRDPTDAIIISVFLQHFAAFWTGVWLLLYRLSGKQEWMLDILAWGFVSAWVSALASLLCIMTPGVLQRPPNGEEIPQSRLRLAAFASAVGVFCVLVVLSVQPNTAELLEVIRPWIP